MRAPAHPFTSAGCTGTPWVEYSALDVRKIGVSRGGRKRVLTAVQSNRDAIFSSAERRRRGRQWKTHALLWSPLHRSRRFHGRNSASKGCSSRATSVPEAPPPPLLTWPWRPAGTP